VAEILLIALALGWCAMRFVGLGKSPFGLSTDETLAGLHVECLAQTGRSADGQRWPLFATGLDGGLYTPTYLYTLFAWTRLFGISVTSLRGLNAALSLLAIVGLWLLARRVADGRAARLTVVAAALSPWSFQLSRLGTDGPMAPMFLVWGVYLFLRSPRAPWAALGGVVMSLAAYTYPPLRVQMPLVAGLLLVVERKRLHPARLRAFLGSMIVVGLPLAWRLSDGTLMGRSKALSILGDDYVRGHRGQLQPLVFIVKQTMDNLFEHLRPSYLFFTGDANLRHSTQIMGELGWLDILALACFGLAVGAAISKAFRQATVAGEPPSRLWLVAGCAVVAGAFGTLPAALCWEGLPHALRSMGAWPAVALFTGACLSAVWSRSRVVPVVALALALAQTAHFVPYYFRVYPKASYSAWGGELRAAAETGDPARFAGEARRYSDLEFRYYLMRNFGDTCVSSRERAEQIRSGR
jgi:4-amino-4-deoxy-L-arabinose transferase-like glycosyltransferase